MTQHAIAFYSPYPGAGKTLAARAFCAIRTNWHKLSFADPLYAMITELMRGINVQGVGERVHDVKSYPIQEWGGATIRDMLVGLGDAARKIAPDVFVETMRHRLRSPGYDWVGIDDLRFPNEYEMLRQEQVKIVRIVNPERGIVPSTTEALLEGYRFDAVIMNVKGGRQTLADQVREVVSRFW